MGECWLFDPDRRGARVYRRDGDRLRLVAELSAGAGDVLATPLLPGLAIRLSEVLA